jgi:hypothetical protein
MNLFPQIPHEVAEQLAHEFRSKRTVALSSETAFDHPDAFYTPTGGSRIAIADLLVLRKQLLNVATKLGFPNKGHEIQFDANAAQILHSTMEISPAEASKPGVWEFLSCVLMCDLVRWRFPGDSSGTPPERFFSGRRNTFERLWWRGYVFHDGSAEDPYSLLEKLGEDEIVQIMERPFLAGTRALSQAVAATLLKASKEHPNFSRRHLIREAQKRIRRLGAFISFEAMDKGTLTETVASVFDRVAEGPGS